MTTPTTRENETPQNPTRRAEQLLEEGAAFERLNGPPTHRGGHAEAKQVVVIGAGQAGLSVGYHLRQLGLDFLVLEGGKRIGDQWRRRWDSLRLFTPARYDSLAGMPFPADPDSFPTKDEMADYLEAYAAAFELPVRTGQRVVRVSRREGRYLVQTENGSIEADQVVVAMANYQRPKRPSFTSDLRPDIVQLHSAAYKNPSQLRPGPVLIVGAGNSGSEIAMELSREHEVWMSGRDTGHLPFRIAGFLGRLLLVRLVLKVLFQRILTLNTPLGRKVFPTFTSQGGPLIRVMPKDLAAAGVRRVPRMTGTQDGLPVLEDGRVIEAANVVWCTGFEPGFSWIDLPVLDDRGKPRHRSGVVEEEPGLYFVGLHFLHALSSAMVHGVGRDAERIAREIAKRADTRASAHAA